jgi:hypothetical protein
MMTTTSTVSDITVGTTSTEADLGMEDFAAVEDFTAEAEAGAADDGGGHSQSKNHKNMKMAQFSSPIPGAGHFFHEIYTPEYKGIADIDRGR